MRKHHILYIVIVAIVFILSLMCVGNISALSYQAKTGVSFTFEPTLSISLSSNDLVIPNLVPGSSSDSNSINVSVATNAAYGYTLSTIVNGANSNLTHTNETNIFSSIDTNANLASLDNSEYDNVWGYSTSLDNGSSWSNYNGLSSITSNTTNTLVDTNHQIEDTIGFKIGAKAGSNQPSGVYTSIINFTAVAKPTPETITDLEYLQDFAYISPTDLASVKNSMPMNSTFTLKDQRDEQEYTIAKLSDNKIWMTKNLNLAGGTEITSELSDVPEGYTLPIANGFLEGNRLPISSQEGFNDDTKAYVYNTSNNTDNCASPGCYSYYSWNAATAGSGVNITADDTDASYSICPKGWKLPNSRSTVTGNSDFYQLAIAYGMSQNDTLQYTDVFYNNAGSNTIPNFLLVGNYMNGTNNNADTNGNYWSSTSYDRGEARALNFNIYTIRSTFSYFRRSGMAIRCLAR